MHLHHLLLVAVGLNVVASSVSAAARSVNFRAKSLDEWQNPYFPQPPGKLIDDNPTVEVEDKNKDLFDSKHGIKMGVASPDCDDAQTNLTVDWDFSPTDYTCFEDRSLYKPRSDVSPTYKRDHIPANYVAQHKCMSTPITYDDPIPTFGTHRPLWAKFGEYRYLPPQRWLHDLEHGGIALLYHPCADQNELALLKKLVTHCLYRHIITANNQLSPERPFALVTWGQRLMMSKVNSKLVVEFIKQTALQGPERTHANGQYDVELLQSAYMVSDIDDTVLCPHIIIE